MPNPKTSHCCICRVADRDLAAFHAIEEALLNSSRARGNGKPSCTEIARRFIYLWPGGKVDNLRKRLEHHFACHLIDKMVDAREAEQEVTKSLNDEVDDFLCMIKRNVQELQKEAEKPDADKRFWLYASQASIPGTNLLTRLAQPEKAAEPQNNITINFSNLTTEELEQYERLRGKLEGSKEGTGEEKAA